MELYFPKLYRYDRAREHCSVAVPFAAGKLRSADGVKVFQDEKQMPVQTKVTSRYRDGSIRYLFVRFLADLPGNQKAVLRLKTGAEEEADPAAGAAECIPYEGLTMERLEHGFVVNGGLRFCVSDGAASLFDWLEDGNARYEADQFDGPFLEDGDGGRYTIRLGKWRAAEEGPLAAVLRCMGECVGPRPVTFEVKLTAYAEKPWVEIAYRIINSTDQPLALSELKFSVLAHRGGADSILLDKIEDAKTDSRSSGERAASVFMKEECPPDADGGNAEKRIDEAFKERTAETVEQGTGKQATAGEIFRTKGTLELSEIESRIKGVRTCAANSNYKTDFLIGSNAAPVEKTVDAEYLLKENNEHMAEVLYGTFFADRTGESGGVCATIFQAQQNYPKAVRADNAGVHIFLVPKGGTQVIMQSGMSREQRFLLHFHGPECGLLELDDRSLIYQMPDRPSIPPEVFRDAGVMPDIFVDREKRKDDVEIALIGRCDSHARCYGMLNWGDAPDPGYTAQGRGGGKLVWTNNEYDYPHACALFYARTGERRFLDYMLTAASHWMDVDVCHYSDDPLLLGGQWEHCRSHTLDSTIVCSHEWVEGLLDYYHFSGDERALKTAVGIGENVLRLLDTPMYQRNGEVGARETGWALRTLTALYVETGEDRWLPKCERIVEQFRQWKETYGGWLAAYTDNTMIRTGFMIAVAIGSLMRYYRVSPKDEIRTMILDAVDDLVENCLMDNGLFHYKELPSLNRLGNNTLILEALTYAWELTGDSRYLRYGLPTFRSAVEGTKRSAGGSKSVVDDALINAGDGTKTFAQSFLPLSLFYKAAADCGLL